jgi:hypothetical protein
VTPWKRRAGERRQGHPAGGNRRGEVKRAGYPGLPSAHPAAASWPRRLGRVGNGARPTRVWQPRLSIAMRPIYRRSIIRPSCATGAAVGLRGLLALLLPVTDEGGQIPRPPPPFPRPRSARNDGSKP